MSKPTLLKHNQEQPRSPDLPRTPDLIFVDASISPSAHKAIISRGRRLQLEKKHREKKLRAQQDATYARSLTGWQPSTSIPGIDRSPQGGVGWLTPRNTPPPIYGRRDHIPIEDVERDDRIKHETQVSPSSILKRGQSDPFNTLAVEVTPEVNEIITFFRENIIPAFYETKWESSKAYIVSMHWQSIVQALHEEGSALAWLGRNGQILGIVSNNKRMKLAALKYTTESTTILRNKLDQIRELSETDQWHITMLWGTEILFPNLDAALLHGHMIRRMVEEQANKGTLNLMTFRYILYFDTNLCTILMVRSVFDYLNWVPDNYQVLKPLATSFMRLPIEGEDDAAIGLTQVYYGANFCSPSSSKGRRHMREYAYWLERSFEELSLYLHGWLAVCHHICHGQLITHALDCMDNLAKASAHDKSSLLIEAYLSLAALYVTRAAAGGQLILCGIDVFEARRSILDKLYAVLRLTKGVSSRDHLFSNNARLWALYVGAQGAATLMNKPDSYQWFANEFNSTREEMGMSSWWQVQQVLMGFLYSGTINPIDHNEPIGQSTRRRSSAYEWI